jgi:hypothetical protein
MPFDDPTCFRLDRIPVRPIHWLWLWRPYLGLNVRRHGRKTVPQKGEKATFDLKGYPGFPASWPLWGSGVQCA